MPRNRIYSFLFDGHYPVGACGHVKASSLEAAVEEAKRLVKAEGLDPETVSSVALVKESAVLLNGDY